MFELPLDIPQKARRPEPEEVVPHPAVPQLVLHEREIHQRVLRLRDPARGLVAHPEPGPRVIVPDRTDHRQAHREGRVHALLAGRGLDEIRSRHHAHQRRLRHIAKRPQFPRGEDRLHMRLPASLPEGPHLVVKRLPVPRQHVPPRNHDVDLARPRLHALPDLGHPQVERRQPGRKPRRHGGHRNPRALQRLDGRGHHVVIDADGAHRQPLHPERVEQVPPHRLRGLRAEPPHATGRIVARQRGEVDAGDRPQKPGRLMVLLDRPPPGQRRRPPLDGRGVGLHRRHPVEVQRHAGVARLVQLRQLGGDRRGRRLRLGGVHAAKTPVPPPRRSHGLPGLASLTGWSKTPGGGPARLSRDSVRKLR